VELRFTKCLLLPRGAQSLTPRQIRFGRCISNRSQDLFRWFFLWLIMEAPHALPLPPSLPPQIRWFPRGSLAGCADSTVFAFSNGGRQASRHCEHPSHPQSYQRPTTTLDRFADHTIMRLIELPRRPIAHPFLGCHRRTIVQSLVEQGRVRVPQGDRSRRVDPVG